MFWWLVFLLFLTACGRPQYVVRYQYLPPQSPEARSCLKDCERRFERCKEECLKKQNECRRQARSQAEKLYRRSLKTYQEELNLYRKRYRLYHQELVAWNDSFRRLYEDYLFFKKNCQKERDDYACRRYREIRKHLDALETQRPLRPKEPKAPDLEKIMKGLLSSCLEDCGCQEKYNYCFLSCGGKLLPKKFCLENCQDSPQKAP